MLRRRPLLLLAVGLVALSAATTGRAQDLSSEPAPPPISDDYDVDNRAWNGLSTLAAIARGSGLQVVVRRTIDWTELATDDVVFLLYPTNRIEPTHLAAFVRGGGRVLVADDFGASAEALARLGILRDEDAIGVDAPRYHDDLAYAPIARPRRPEHPLARGVEELATNHPALLPDVSGPEVVFGFGPGEAVVAAGALGAGRFVALSDPSVLINRMLQFEGNLQFSINLIRYLAADPGSRRLVLLVGDVTLLGEPEVPDPSTALGHFDRFLGDLNVWLDQLNDYLLTEPSLRALAVAVALLIGLFGFAVVPSDRSAPLDGSWTRAGEPAPPVASAEGAIAHWSGAGRRSYAYPAAVLRDHLARRLGAALGLADPFELSPEQLAGAVRARCGPAAEAALRAVQPRLRALPSRAQAASPWEAGALSRREFERLHLDCERLYRTLEDSSR